MQRHTNVGIVDFLSGQYKDFSELDLASSDDLVNVLYASLSSVGFTAPVEAFGSSFVDGAAVWAIDITSAVNTCAHLGYAHDSIVVDVVMTANKQIAFEDTTEFNSLQMLYRYLTIARYYGTMDGITRAQFAYPDVEFRYVIAPSAKLPHNHNPLKMDASSMELMFSQGKLDAANAINSGSGVSIKQLTAHYNEVKKVKNPNEVQDKISNIIEKLAQE